MDIHYIRPQIKKGWFSIEKEISLESQWGGYTAYELTIPESSFTESIIPNPNKILRLTKKNYKDFSLFYKNKV